MNLNFLDILIIVFLFLCIITGYYSGFAKRFLSFCGTVLALFLAFIFSKPVSLFLSFKISDFTKFPIEILNNVYPIVYRMIAFIVILVILLIIKSIILMVLKPVVKTIIDCFKITGGLDSILGAVLSFVKGIMFVYVALLFMCLPINSNKFSLVHESIVANKILNIIPEISDSITQINQFDEVMTSINAGDLNGDHFDLEKLDEKSLQSFHSLAKCAIDLGIINENQMTQYSISTAKKIQNMPNSVGVSKKEKEQLDKILDLPGVSEDLKIALNNKIYVK